MGALTSVGALFSTRAVLPRVLTRGNKFPYFFVCVIHANRRKGVVSKVMYFRHILTRLCYPREQGGNNIQNSFDKKL